MDELATCPSLAGIEQRTAAATEGSWWTTRTVRPPVVFSGDGSASDVAVLEAFEFADAEFIAHARTDLPALTATVRDVLKIVDEARAMAQALNARSERASHGQVLYVTHRIVEAIATHLDLTDPEGEPT